MRKTTSMMQTASVTRPKKQMRQGYAQSGTRQASALQRSAVQQLRNCIALKQRKIQTAEDASALSVARIILQFIEDLPELRRGHRGSVC
jgi:hypothetical protein